MRAISWGNELPLHRAPFPSPAPATTTTSHGGLGLRGETPMFPGSPCRGRGRPAPVPAGTPLRTSRSSAQKRLRVLWQGHPGGQGVRPSPPQTGVSPGRRWSLPPGGARAFLSLRIGSRPRRHPPLGALGSSEDTWSPVGMKPKDGSARTVLLGGTATRFPFGQNRGPRGERPPGGQPWWLGQGAPARGALHGSSWDSWFSAVGGDGPGDLGPPASFL